jgi:hypothetical protein
MAENSLIIEDLQTRIRDLKDALPAHSIPPAMLIELEDLQEQLEKMVEGMGDEPDASA